jgi:DNA-directed RNA polymerase specialized sigma24 family protein
MAKDDRVEALLIEWAQWLTVGDGSGYASMSVLHVDWQPPSPGQTPTMKTSHPSRARRLHQRIGLMSQRLSNTLVIHYCLRLPIDKQALRLECSVSTVHARIDICHRALRQSLAEALI